MKKKVVGISQILSEQLVRRLYQWVKKTRKSLRALVTFSSIGCDKVREKTPNSPILSIILLPPLSDNHMPPMKYGTSSERLCNIFYLHQYMNLSLRHLARLQLLSCYCAGNWWELRWLGSNARTPVPKCYWNCWIKLHKSRRCNLPPSAELVESPECRNTY